MNESQNKNLAKRLAELFYATAASSNYPEDWTGWTDPVTYYMFEVSDGSVELNQMSSLGKGWWLGTNDSIAEIESPTQEEWEAGVFFIPMIKFLRQGDQVLTRENYCCELFIGRRGSLDDVSHATRLDQLPMIWKGGLRL